MHKLMIDLETRSDADITKTGVYRYADSPYFDILLFAYSVDDAPVQITSAPAQIAVSINHDNATHDQIAQSGKFALAILATDTDPALIGGFGYRSSRDADKFAGVSCTEKDGMPVPDGAMAWIICRVVKLMDAGTHTIFLGEVTDCDLNREDGIPMTYQFYHSVIKGASPKNAPTYISPED